MSYGARFRSRIEQDLEQIRKSGLYKNERVLESSQGAEIDTEEGRTINFCANNYLGLASDPQLIGAVTEGMRARGFGVAAARFICGTQDIHKRLERRISRFLRTEAAILYVSCFDANGGLFEALLGPEDCVISDELNHASIIDGIRLSKAARSIYRHIDMENLESKLRQAQDYRSRLIATDGVFSMQGDLAPLTRICDLAEKYDALVMVDDSHATGLIGRTGRGTPEHFGEEERIDVLTSTLAKAMGGATGGFTTGRRSIIELLRQKSRPYLFSNSVAPPMIYGALKAIEILERSTELVTKLRENSLYFRKLITAAGFTIPEGIHPIVPILMGDERKTIEMARELYRRGIFVVGFSYPVVPRGQARIRVQISAAHTREQLDLAVQAFSEVARELHVIA
jgi:glycine C-acetyltransferase